MKNKLKLSVVLATRNEAENIARCLESVKGVADEVIIFDEYSDDATRDIAEKFGAKVYLEPHHDIFHITKQKALEKANGYWILQLDADEVVTPNLAQEIKKIVQMTNDEILQRNINNEKIWKLYKSHQNIVESRDGKIGTDSMEIVGFFISRVNIFLGKPLTYAGVFPDGVIRLVKNGYAKFPQKSVHEQIQLNGGVSWLENSLEHYDSPTFKRYLSRANRYTDLTAHQFEKDNIAKGIVSFFYFVFIKPTTIFFSLFFRHRGFLDGAQGFIWSFFSAMHYPISFSKKNQQTQKHKGGHS